MLQLRQPRRSAQREPDNQPLPGTGRRRHAPSPPLGPPRGARYAPPPQPLPGARERRAEGQSTQGPCGRPPRQPGAVRRCRARAAGAAGQRTTRHRTRRGGTHVLEPGPAADFTEIRDQRRQGTDPGGGGGGAGSARPCCSEPPPGLRASEDLEKAARRLWQPAPWARCPHQDQTGRLGRFSNLRAKHLTLNDSRV